MHGEGWMFFGRGWMWLFWIVIIALLVFFINGVGGNKETPSTKQTPLDILKARYARGEIDEEAFERMRKQLKA